MKREVGLLADLRHAIRVLRREPGYSVVALLAIALSIMFLLAATSQAAIHTERRPETSSASATSPETTASMRNRSPWPSGPVPRLGS